MVAFGQRFASNPAWTAALALVHIETSNAAAARVSLAEALDSFRSQGRDSFWLVCAVLMAEAAYRLEDAAVGRELAGVLEPFQGRGLVVGPSTVFLGAIDRYLGLAELARGDRDAARRALTQAASFNRAMGAEPLLAHCLFDGALAGTDEAASHVAEARSIAVRLGMHPLLDRIESAVSEDRFAGTEN